MVSYKIACKIVSSLPTFLPFACGVVGSSGGGSASKKEKKLKDRAGFDRLFPPKETDKAPSASNNTNTNVHQDNSNDSINTSGVEGDNNNVSDNGFSENLDDKDRMEDDTDGSGVVKSGDDKAYQSPHIKVTHPPEGPPLSKVEDRQAKKDKTSAYPSPPSQDIQSSVHPLLGGFDTDQRKYMSANLMNNANSMLGPGPTSGDEFLSLRSVQVMNQGISRSITRKMYDLPSDLPGDESQFHEHMLKFDSFPNSLFKVGLEEYNHDCLFDSTASGLNYNNRNNGAPAFTGQGVRTAVVNFMEDKGSDGRLLSNGDTMSKMISNVSAADGVLRDSETYFEWMRSHGVADGGWLEILGAACCFGQLFVILTPTMSEEGELVLKRTEIIKSDSHCAKSIIVLCLFDQHYQPLFFVGSSPPSGQEWVPIIKYISKALSSPFRDTTSTFDKDAFESKYGPVPVKNDAVALVHQASSSSSTEPEATEPEDLTIASLKTYENMSDASKKKSGGSINVPVKFFASLPQDIINAALKTLQVANERRIAQKNKNINVSKDEIAALEACLGPMLKKHKVKAAWYDKYPTNFTRCLLYRLKREYDFTKSRQEVDKERRDRILKAHYDNYAAPLLAEMPTKPSPKFSNLNDTTYKSTVYSILWKLLLTQPDPSQGVTAIHCGLSLYNLSFLNDIGVSPKDDGFIESFLKEYPKWKGLCINTGYTGVVDLNLNSPYGREGAAGFLRPCSSLRKSDGSKYEFTVDNIKYLDMILVPLFHVHRGDGVLLEEFSQTVINYPLYKIQPDPKDENPLQMTSALECIGMGQDSNSDFNTVFACLARNVIGNPNCMSKEAANGNTRAIRHIKGNKNFSFHNVEDNEVLDYYSPFLSPMSSSKWVKENADEADENDDESLHD